MILKEREKQILRLMAEGHCKQFIAEKLNISKRTVEKYQEFLKGRNGLKTLYQAMYHFGLEESLNLLLNEID